MLCGIFCTQFFRAHLQNNLSKHHPGIFHIQLCHAPIQPHKPCTLKPCMKPCGNMLCINCTSVDVQLIYISFRRLTSSKFHVLISLILHSQTLLPVNLWHFILLNALLTGCPILLKPYTFFAYYFPTIGAFNPVFLAQFTSANSARFNHAKIRPSKALNITLEIINSTFKNFLSVITCQKAKPNCQKQSLSSILLP